MQTFWLSNLHPVCIILSYAVTFLYRCIWPSDYVSIAFCLLPRLNLNESGMRIMLISVFFSGIPAGVTLIPDSPGMGSTYLFAPNTSATRAYLCPQSSRLSAVTVLNATIGESETTARNTVIYLQGNCSDGSKLPEFTIAPGSDAYLDLCLPLGYPSGYTFYKVTIVGSGLSSSIPYRYGMQSPSIVFLCLPVFLACFTTYHLSWLTRSHGHTWIAL